MLVLSCIRNGKRICSCANTWRRSGHGYIGLCSYLNPALESRHCPTSTNVSPVLASHVFLARSTCSGHFIHALLLGFHALSSSTEAVSCSHQETGGPNSLSTVTVYQLRRVGVTACRIPCRIHAVLLGAALIRRNPVESGVGLKPSTTCFVL